MDRQIVYPGAIPLDTDLLSVQRNIMIALGALAQACLGTNTVVDGLGCVPTVPASLTVNVGPGSISQLTVMDALAFGSLQADLGDPLLKMGINIASTPFALTAPTTSGQSANFLIQACLLESDISPVVLPYYNAVNPGQPYSGPAGSGGAQNTQRIQRVQLQLKPGSPAPTGTQATPAIDAGWVGLYVITVGYAQTAITAGNITPLPAAPFIYNKLPSLSSGFSRNAVFSVAGSTVWTAPSGVARVRVRVIGAGGGGGAGASGYSGGGGGAGGYAEGIFVVTPGTAITITVGGGGAGGSSAAAGSAGGSSSFGTLCSATGGSGGNTNNSPNYAGGAGGLGVGGQINCSGGYGSDGASVSFFGGLGGASALGGGGRASIGGNYPTNGQAPGSGGGGAYSTNGTGGTGANGIVICEY